MACVITSPRDAIRRPLQNCTYKHIVRLHYDAIYSFGCFIFNFMKPSSAVNYLYVHTDDSGVEALLFAVKRLITAVSESCRKMRRKVLHDSNSQPRLIGNTCPLHTFLQNWKKLTYMYDSLQFPVEMNTRGSKTLTTFIPFTRSVTYRNSFDYFLTVTCRMVCYDFKTILTSCTIWKLILLNVVITYTASYVWVY